MSAPASRSCSRIGFTLIEVLAAMAVLVLLVLALTRMFVEAANITKRGTTMLMRTAWARPRWKPSCRTSRVRW